PVSIKFKPSKNPYIQGFSVLGSGLPGSTYALRSSRFVESEGGLFNIKYLLKYFYKFYPESFGGSRSTP
ncbi:MAG: hypothetical protein WBM42_15015, partial [Eudoraea sp.]|uniref:hypothetical protein n=1 Tax=Eudoraea sp. TaxID=1979955 RepID=UPI003C732BF0